MIMSGYFFLIFLLVTSCWAVQDQQAERVVRNKRALDVDSPSRTNKTPSSPDLREDSRNPLPGSTYIRWGRTICPNGSEVVYKGVAGGSHYTLAGGGSNLLCMTSQPIWGDYNDAKGGFSYIYGTEYETGWPFQNDNIDSNTHVDQDVPCVVCLTSGRSTNVMIPGRNECLGEGWALEYHGYLMGGHNGHKRAEFVCVDIAPEADPAGSENKGGVLLYYTEAHCGSLPCPPYVQYREITCAVCSK